MPDNEIAYCNRGIALAKLNRWPEALPNFERAVSLQPRYAVGHYYRGEALKNLGRLVEALPCYQRAVEIEPRFMEAHNSQAYIHYNLGNLPQALTAYEKVLRLSPDKPLIKGRVLHLKMLCCNWNGLESLIATIEREMNEGRISATPFEWQAVANSPRSAQLCAEIYCRDRFPAQQAMTVAAPKIQRRKIRLGYVSGEFRNQATAHLLTGVIEHHDKSRFEVYIVDNGWDDGSDWRKRIVAASDAILSIRGIDDNTAARTVASAEIDLLVNLN